jgi:UDP-N-acetylglucosamine 2-epimerase
MGPNGVNGWNEPGVPRAGGSEAEGMIGTHARRMKIPLAGGARPHFMKVTPLSREDEFRDGAQLVLAHTGQHCDAELSDAFFSDLGIRPPDNALSVGSSSQAQ